MGVLYIILRIDGSRNWNTILWLLYQIYEESLSNVWKFSIPSTHDSQIWNPLNWLNQRSHHLLALTMIDMGTLHRMVRTGLHVKLDSKLISPHSPPSNGSTLHQNVRVWWVSKTTDGVAGITFESFRTVPPPFISGMLWGRLPSDNPHLRLSETWSHAVGHGPVSRDKFFVEPTFAWNA
jgi:hypothetical protein